MFFVVRKTMIINRKSHLLDSAVVTFSTYVHMFTKLQLKWWGSLFLTQYQKHISCLNFKSTNMDIPYSSPKMRRYVEFLFVLLSRNY